MPHSTRPSTTCAMLCFLRPAADRRLMLLDAARTRDPLGLAPVNVCVCVPWGACRRLPQTQPRTTKCVMCKACATHTAAAGAIVVHRWRRVLRRVCDATYRSVVMLQHD